MVYISGEAKPTTTISDAIFGVEVTQKTRLNRNVEMFQWVEEKSSKKEKQIGGGTKTVTTYNYNKKWTSSPQDSSSFNRPQGHTNPSMPYVSDFFYSDVFLGAFALPTDMITGFPSDASLTSTIFDVNSIPTDNVLKAAKNVTKDGDGFYFGNSQFEAVVGDTRVQYSAASGGLVSIIAMQSGNTFLPYRAKSGSSLYYIEMGTVSASTMFDKATDDNKTLTMILRIVGAVVMTIGIGLILNPLAVVADIIPCIGDCVECAIGVVSALIGIFLSLIVIGIAWVANRPIVLGVGLAGAAVIGYFVYNGVQKKKERSRELDLESVKDLEMERE